MPRSSVVLSAEPITAEAISAAVTSLGSDVFALRGLDDGAVLQVLALDEVVLSVLRPRLLPTLDEVQRLLPGATAPEGTRWWTEVYTPWHQGGLVGARVLEAAATAVGGIVVGQAPRRRSDR